MTETSTPPSPVERNSPDVERNHEFAALSYAWVMSVVLLFSKRQSPFVRFHAKQGLILFILSILFVFIPYANRVLELLIFTLMIWGFIEADLGRWTELPVIGPLSRGKLSFKGVIRQPIGALKSAFRAFRALRSDPTIAQETITPAYVAPIVKEKLAADAASHVASVDQASNL